MSNWLHVAAIARVDELKDIDFEEYFSPMPKGSEDGLTITCWVNPKENHANRYTVSLFGDLRHRDDPQSIVDWFKDKCRGLYIRNAAITVHNGFEAPVVWCAGWMDKR